MLQATHGVVSGEPEFYKAAFGDTHAEFEDILSRPHHMIFNRQWYERYEGRGELDDYRALLHRMAPSERAELLAFLSARNPALYARDLRELPENLRRVANFHLPLSRAVESEFRRVQSARLKADRTTQINLTTEEIVEDAGLDEEELAMPRVARKRKRAKEAA